MTTVSDSEYTDRRRRLIETLRAGTYAPHKHALYKWELNHNGLRDYQQFPIGHCCIGVGLRLIGVNFGGPAIVCTNYDTFNVYYDTSQKIQNYLAGMNDGSTVYMERDVYGEEGDSRKIIRESLDSGIVNNSRSHAFIARWLEIVWGLNA